MKQLSARTRFALELIRERPEAMAWPGRFADAFWPEDFTSPTTGHRLHGQRNHKSAPMASWWAAGYLGRLRKAGLIGGGYYERLYTGSYGREPLYLTDQAEELLKDTR